MSRNRIPNYSEWDGNGHPPACTCYDCNEARNRRIAADTADAYEERLRAVNQRRTLTETRRATNANPIRATHRGGETKRRWFGLLFAVLIVGGMFGGVAFAQGLWDEKSGRHPPPSPYMVAIELTPTPVPVVAPVLPPTPMPVPTFTPTSEPTATPRPTHAPTPLPTPKPATIPTPVPTSEPTAIPAVVAPTPTQTLNPTVIPTTASSPPTPLPEPTGDPSRSRPKTDTSINLDPAVIEQKVIEFTNQEAGS